MRVSSYVQKSSSKHCKFSKIYNFKNYKFYKFTTVNFTVLRRRTACNEKIEQFFFLKCQDYLQKSNKDI